MASFEWNKIIASILTAMIVAWVSGILATQLIEPKRPEKPVFMPVGAEQVAAAPAEQPAAGKLEPIEPLLAKADPKRGEQLAKVCTTCHTFDKGGPNKIGPNLWDVTEENIATVPNYQFSAALQAEKGEKWDPEKLNQWLHNPQSFAKGTKMTFAGFPKAQDRADVIAYLDTLK
ncbi:MAG: cytochrome c family protein [Alphaproteobacteria bacterium]|nr:cytochrome c family protein [Alphaproteobacteria bacterium]